MLEKDQEVKMDVQAEQAAPAQETPSSAQVDASAQQHSHHHSHHHHRHHHSHHHSHHRHHSHHHNSKRSSSRNSLRKRLKQFIRNHRKKLIVFCGALLFCFCSLMAGSFMKDILHRDERYSGNSDAVVAVDEGMVSIGVSVFDAPVSLVNSAVQAHLQASVESNVADIYAQYNGAGVRLDVGVPLELSYTITHAPNHYVVQEAAFALSESEDMSNPLRQTVPNGRDTVEFANLKTGTDYYYRLTVTFTNGVESVVLGKVTTAHSPRMMTMDGGYNFRDVGGWLVSDGKRIKQGLLYRGCEIDGAVESKYTLTETGKSYMLTQLNIKTDMDLRNAEETPNGADVLGANVKHTYYNAPSYTAALSAENSETLRRIFADLANPNQYPAYIHGTYGLDRTGTVCYLLGALLGVDQDNLLKEYQLSAMSQGRVDAGAMDALVQRVNELPGFTLSEKVENYLLKVGVTSAQIQSIRHIFLEDVE